MQAKEISYESNGFTFIDHQNGKVSIPWKGGRYLEFQNSTLETVEQFADALKDFLEMKRPTTPFKNDNTISSEEEDKCDCDCENRTQSGDDDDEEEDGDLTSIHDNENVTIDFQADENGRVPFEVAMVAMRQWLRVREQQRGKWLFAAMDENGEFSDETNAVYEISSAEMFKGKREIVQPTAIITKKSK